MEGMLIDGALRRGDHDLGVINPATGEEWIRVPRASIAEMEQAIAAARRAQPAWAALPLAERQSVLAAIADAMEARADELARTIVREQGKPFGEAQAEAGYAVAFVRAFAQMTVAPDILQDDAQLRIELRRKPLGLVVGITPWNFPLMIAAYKMAPALLMGNAFLLKPAPTTPVSALLLGEIVAKIVPPGVVGVLVDDNDIGPRLAEHPDVHKISFTGSTATGKRVMAAAANTLKRLTLELGGNDVAIVLDDVDVPAVAERLFNAAFFNAGQVCIAVKRIYAHAAIYDALCAALVRLANAAVQGDGLEQGVTIGPMQNAAQFEKARRYLDVARRDGRVIAGGHSIEGKGYFIAPTIVADIGDDSPLVTEEQFAPILPVMPFEEIGQVIDRANAGPYGLGGSVWSSDEGRAHEIACQLDSGTIWVNHHLHFAPNIPFSGAKESGVGVEFGREGLNEYAQMAVVSIARRAA